MTTANPRVTDLDITSGTYADDCLVMQAVRAAQAGQRVRITDHGTAVAMITPPEREPGAETLRATARGDSVDAIQSAALEQARELYGPDAGLEITHTGAIATAHRSRPGRKFAATVTVRRTGQERQA